MYGHNVHEYALDYIHSFWSQYADMPKLFNVHLSEAHESTAELPKYLDADMQQFLVRFEKNGWLSNTTVFFMSDHGNHMHVLLRLLENFNRTKVEIYDPLLITITPPGLIGDENLVLQNAHQLLNMYDVRKTILSLIGYSPDKLDSDKGHDIFNEVLEYKSCNDAQIPRSCCRCAELV